MSYPGSLNCLCPDRRKNREGSGEWVVLARKQNRQAWGTNYGQLPPIQKSRWSHVMCSSCGAHFRTLAAYVDTLPDASPELIETVTGKLRQGERVPLKVFAKVQRRAIRHRGRPRLPARRKRTK